MKNNNHIIASIGTAVFMLLLLLLLYVIYMEKPEQQTDMEIEYLAEPLPEEEEPRRPVETSPASASTAQVPNPQQPTPKTTEPAPAEQTVAPQVSPKPATDPTPKTTNNVTQQEESPVKEVKTPAEDNEKERVAALARQKREADSIAAVKAEQARIAAEQKQKTDKANSLINGNLFGTVASTGTAQEEGGKKGNPASGVGKGVDANGNGWSLNGRDLIGKLDPPLYNSNAEGVVVVAIRVNADGKVISATQGMGTTTSDTALLNAAFEAARNATFTKGQNDVLGTITYVFNLK